MKKLYFYSIITLCIFSVLGCTHMEDVVISNPEIEMVITATTESGNDTKAMMGEAEDDGSRSVLWEPGDSIRIMCEPLDYAASCRDTGHIFVNTGKESGQTATFEGSMGMSSTYLALYPASIANGALWWDGSRSVNVNTIKLPTTQMYRENNFDKNGFPMAAYQIGNIHKNYTIDGPFEFKNLCGVLALNLIGEDKIKSITITAKDTLGNPAVLAGNGYLDRTSDGFYILRMASHDENLVMGIGVGSPSVALMCPDVQLNPTTPTTFHIVLPPNVYSSFSLYITTSDGKIMTVHSNKELKINRSKARHTTSLEYVETPVIDLSEKGTANSYIVQEAGVYKIDASVIGNGSAGIIPDAGFHTDNPDIAPEQTKLLWEDTPGLISSVSINKVNKEITFVASGKEGNALIAAMSADGTILWSWHIWCTDQPEEHTYINASSEPIVVHDRNLGAIRADRGTGVEWMKSMGLVYQWGRKDPFTIGFEIVTNSQRYTIEESIKYPQHAVNMYDYWLLNVNNKLWTDSTKTIYDPCPLGYKVAPKDTWTGFTNNGYSQYTKEYTNIDWTRGWEHGCYIKYDGTNSAWYPVIYMGPGITYNEEEIECWSSNAPEYSYGQSYRLYIHYQSFSGHLDVSPNSMGTHNLSRAVRCAQDVEYMDTKKPQVELLAINDIENDGATFVANVIEEGEDEVTERGFVWGTSHNPIIDKDSKIEVGAGLGEYSAHVEGLDDLTQYYVRSYAINKSGVAYSAEKGFVTLYGGEIIDLSLRGTSNSYIVSSEGVYSFDVSVIGNGSEGIIPNAGFHTNNPDIYPANIELLWEDNDSIISYLTYDPSTKKASFAYNGKEGNVLLAAKDNNGSIIWSWHIWCTDKPNEHRYVNHGNQIFYVMDRNLGATRADRGSGDQWKEAVGLLYQWGRKDPFTYHPKIMKIGYQLSIQESIENADRLCSQYEWMANGNTRLWSDTTKTIYDPCPTGYKVAPRAIWTGFIQEGLSNTQRENQINKKGNFNKGWDFLYDGVNSAYYPTTERGGYWDINYSPSETDGRYWSSTSEGAMNRGYGLYFRFQDSYNLDMNNLSNEGSGYAGSIRCVADNNYVDPTLPTVSKVVISSITAKGASAKVSVTSSGSSAVTAKGVVWSTEPNPTIELSTKTENGTGSGDYTAVLTGLNDFTKYYVRSYATNSYGTAYGPEVEFSTKFGGEATDLSSTESANSYIVNEPATFYKFKAVKGNSSQTLENAFYASVVWETFGTNERPLLGDLIEKAVYQDGYIVFKTSSTSKEGNALIAAKDSEGTILWSWHIWVTDTPAEHTYANGLAVLMDRNLGATSATPGDVQALGLLYQWGRKDPFLGSSSTTEAIEAASTIIWPASQFYTTHGNIEYVTSHPTTYIRSLDYNNENDWYYGHNTTLWGEDKTIYDPCPVGWKVASMGDKNPWSNDNFFLLPRFDNANHGYLITLKSGEQAWYPLAGDRYVHGVLESINHRGIIWSSNGLSETTGNSFAYWSDGGINPYGILEWKAKACSVRCQKIQ